MQTFQINDIAHAAHKPHHCLRTIVVLKHGVFVLVGKTTNQSLLIQKRERTLVCSALMYKSPNLNLSVLERIFCSYPSSSSLKASSSISFHLTPCSAGTFSVNHQSNTNAKSHHTRTCQFFQPRAGIQKHPAIIRLLRQRLACEQQTLRQGFLASLVSSIKRSTNLAAARRECRRPLRFVPAAARAQK